MGSSSLVPGVFGDCTAGNYDYLLLLFFFNIYKKIKKLHGSLN